MARDVDDAIDRQCEEQQPHHDAVVGVALLGRAEEAQREEAERERHELGEYSEQSGGDAVNHGAGPRANAKPFGGRNEHGTYQQEEGRPVAPHVGTHGFGARAH